jgi:protein phosphatase
MKNTNIKIPELSLVVLVGVSGSGKSTFARKHFKITEILTSDACRAIVSDDENDQTATKDAFDLLKNIASIRLRRGLITVVDATNVQADSRKDYIQLAREYHCLPVAIVLDLPEKVLIERTRNRTDRDFGSHVIPMQRNQLKRSIKFLKKEGFRHVYVLKSEEEIEAIEKITREPLYNNLKHEQGPFDIIGDIHGCYDELKSMLNELGYEVKEIENDGKNFGLNISHPENRKVIFLGDLVDRGPKVPEVLKLAMSMVNSGYAFCVPGNHDVKLFKKLNGANVQIKHGLEQSLEQLAKETPEFIEKVKVFLDGLVSHYVLDSGNLVVAHAGLTEEMHGRGSGAVRSFCLFGETTGETDEFGLPVRFNWASEYKGRAMVVYGHTPVPSPQWLNKTICLDTGCVFGGKLTAMRYPEKEIISVPALMTYCQPARPIDYNPKTGLSFQQEHDDLLDIDDVIGKHFVSTKLMHNITIREDNSIAALEVMSRFAVNPKWLIYLPPTMSPSETSHLPGMLEHPKEALQYFASQGIERVVCEEKHMGSRAVIVICKDEDAALKRFGVGNEGIGVCYTRTGRNFFNDENLEKEFLLRVRDALTKTSFWEKFDTDWVCLDCELMPWSAKAQTLLKDQYAAVGAASNAALPSVVEALTLAKGRGIATDKLIDVYSSKKEMSEKFVSSYRNYCWEVKSLDDYTLAPFHIMATEGKLHTDKDHVWHMENIKSICEGDKTFFLATPYKVIHVNKELEVNEAIQWWNELTEKGGEGMVVKPLNFINEGKKGLIQPAVKCRGKEYLRIIYGSEYTADENIQRLRSRGLAGKRGLALREFALGNEGLERFVNKEPLRKVHECVFGVLALESEPVDPRL